jgi:lipoyl(octanoyl) transferase
MMQVATGVDWVIEPQPVPYGIAVARMDQWVDSIAAGTMGERIWLLEHPAVITAGTSADPSELLEPGRFPVVASGRGGRFTYHAPGQRILYVMLDLRQRGRDVRALVASLEAWVVDSLARLGVSAFTDPAGTGVWVRTDGRLAKIGAVGLRVRRWVSFHGLAINVSNDLSGFSAILPCGIREHGVCRLADLATGATMAALDAALLASFPQHFGGSARVGSVPA